MFIDMDSRPRGHGLALPVLPVRDPGQGDELDLNIGLSRPYRVEGEYRSWNLFLLNAE